MRTRAVVICSCLTLCALGIVSCTSQPDDQTDSRTDSTPTLAGVQLVVGEPVVSERMAIYPVISQSPLNEDPFVTLGEALEAGTVEVSEIGERGDSAEVNQLQVRNTSPKPLYLMPGELLMGGNQDRCVAEETVLAAGEDWKPIDVYCVEHGRWTVRDSALTEEFLASAVSSDNAVAQGSLEVLSAATAQGKFVASPGLLSKSARLSVQDARGQNDVWDKVAMANAANMTETDSGTFTENYNDEKIAESLKQIKETFEDQISAQENVVGVVIVIDGKPRMCDLYGSTPLFRKLWPKLLQSYALDVAMEDDQSPEAHACSLDEVQKFLADTMDESDTEVTDGGGGVKVNRTKRDDKYSFTSRHEDYDAASGVGGFIHKASYE